MNENIRKTIPGAKANYGWSVEVEVYEDGVVRVGQWGDSPGADVVLLSRRQVREIAALSAKKVAK